MELYIEKEFLDKLNASYNEEKATLAQKKVVDILKTYAQIDWYINYTFDTPEQFEQYKLENELFAYRCILKGPRSITSIEENFFEKSRCRQTLIFTNKTEEWFPRANVLGALCFSYDNFETKIDEIINKCHLRIDLSNTFIGWQVIFNDFYQLLPLNKIIISDSYLLDKADIYDTNLFPLIKSISNNKKTIKYFITDILNKKPPFDVKKIHETLNKKYVSSDIKIFHNQLKNFKLHDRLLYTNFYIIDCAIGFNFNQKINSNSQIIVESIFDKYTYDRHRKHWRKFENYFSMVKKSITTKECYPAFSSFH